MAENKKETQLIDPEETVFPVNKIARSATENLQSKGIFQQSWTGERGWLPRFIWNFEKNQQRKAAKWR